MSANLTDILVIYCYSDQGKITFERSEKVFEITPKPEWKMSRFETDPQVLKENCINMGSYVKSIFGHKTPIKLEDEKYARIDYNGKIDSEFPEI